MRRFKSVIGTEHPMVAKVKEITSSEKWAPHSTAMRDVVTQSQNPENYNLIMDTLWNRLDEPPEKWRKVYKALILLEYLALRADGKIIKDIRERSYKLKDLASNFEYVEPVRGENEGRNVRVKAQKLVDLVFDEDRVRDERAKAISSMNKFDGTSSNPPPNPTISSTGFGNDSTAPPTVKKIEDESGLPPPIEFKPTLDGQVGAAAAKEENNVEGFESSFFNEAPKNTGAGEFGFNNGFDNAFTSSNDDGFIDSGNPATASSTKRGVHVEIKSNGAQHSAPSLALPKPPAREPHHSNTGGGGGLDSLFQASRPSPAPQAPAPAPTPVPTPAPAPAPAPAAFPSDSQLEKQRSMNLMSESAFGGPSVFDGPSNTGGSNSFAPSTFDGPSAFGAPAAPAPSPAVPATQPPATSTADPFASMPVMQPENSSFSHLMVVNDETPKTMQLSTEDKKLHERFGFSEVQASLVSLDLAADSTGRAKQKNAQPSRGKSMGRGSGLGTRGPNVNPSSNPPPMSASANPPNYQMNSGYPPANAPPAASGPQNFNTFGAGQQARPPAAAAAAKPAGANNFFM